MLEEIDLRTIGEDDARAAATLVCAIWPKPGRTVDSLAADIATRWQGYAGPESQHPRSYFVRDEGQLIAHATVFPRTLGTSEGDVTVLALARVCTAPAARGRHLGDAMARAALALVDDGSFPFALFQTTAVVRPFYERLGAVLAANRFVNSGADDPRAPAFWDPAVMRYPAHGPWPQGEIDLRGPGW